MKKFFPILSLLMALFILFPYLQTGYYGDDMLNSLTPGALALERQSSLSVALSTARSWIVGSGRLYPLSALIAVPAWNFLFAHLIVYRICAVLLILSNLWIFSATLRRLGVDTRIATLAAIGATGLFQIRNYHDPITSYALLLQILFLMGMGAVFFALSLPSADSIEIPLASDREL
jgi:hypothetical protein